MPHSCALFSTQVRRRRRCQKDLRRLSALPFRLPFSGGCASLQRPARRYGCPRDKLFGHLLGKGAGTMALLAAKPFEHTAHRMGILLLCLAVRKFTLQTGPGFRCTSVLDLYRFATHKEGMAIRVNSNDGVGFVEINPNGEYALGFRNIQYERHTADELAVALDNRQAINLYYVSKCVLKVLKNGVGQVFPTCYRPDGQGSIRTKVSIMPALSDKEECSRLPELERLLNRLLIGLSSVISSSHKANSRDGHLRIQRAFHSMIACLLQCQGIQGLASIEASFRQGMLHCSECLYRAFQIG